MTHAFNVGDVVRIRGDVQCTVRERGETYEVSKVATHRLSFASGHWGSPEDFEPVEQPAPFRPLSARYESEIGGVPLLVSKVEGGSEYTVSYDTKSASYSIAATPIGTHEGTNDGTITVRYQPPTCTITTAEPQAPEPTPQEAFDACMRGILEGWQSEHLCAAVSAWGESVTAVARYDYAEATEWAADAAESWSRAGAIGRALAAAAASSSPNWSQVLDDALAEINAQASSPGGCTYYVDGEKITHPIAKDKQGRPRVDPDRQWIEVEINGVAKRLRGRVEALDADGKVKRGEP